MAGALAQFWQIRGHSAEGTAWLERALALSGSASDLARAEVLATSAAMATDLGDFARAESLLAEAIVLLRAAGAAEDLAARLIELGRVIFQAGRS